MWRAQRSWGQTWLAALLLASACRQPAAEHPRPQPGHPAHAAPEERGTAFVGSAAPREPWLDVPLLGFRVADDDGRHPARVAPADIQRWVDFANDVYRPAGIRFHFAAQDLYELRSSLLNGTMGGSDGSWAAFKRAGDEVAARYPGRLVIFFRHGPGRSATGLGFSGIDLNFVVMPGWQDDRHCGHEHLGSFAHELGHHLGLAHTFPRPFAEPAEAAAVLASAGGNVLVFDGDGLPDTAPDPALRATECLGYQQVKLGGVRIPLARRNIMSYYDQPDSLTEQQISRARWHLLLRRAYQLKLPRNGRAGAYELERLELATQSPGGCWPQPMDPFGLGQWSEGQQLFCSAPGPHSVSVKLPVAQAGWQRLELYATRAPDYGIVEVLLDGQPLATFDAWALSVVATGALRLGQRYLTAGTHELTFVVRRKSSASTGFHLGLDALAVLPVQPVG